MSEAQPLRPPPIDELARLRELLDQHQELDRIQGNRLDELLTELGMTQAKLRAAQWEIARMRTELRAKDPRP